MTILFGIIFFVSWAVSSYYIYELILTAVDYGNKQQMWVQVAMLTADAMLTVFLFNMFRMMFSPVYYGY